MTRQRRGGVAAPQELTSWSLFATTRGYIDRRAKRYDESKLGEWIEARQQWEADHGGFADSESTVADQAPPAELVGFELWCGRRGVAYALATGSNTLAEFADRQEAFGLWCEARSAFAAEHGWPGGRAVRRREETAFTPFDLNAI
ncbi:hypothetical protein FHR72_001737 [Mycolicibacterium iranicum]|uniref:Uncharacterized protein n=1 Tax=Mycolicibacterium iranicum TaxID=912594 RepID=A0A839Q2Z9_MYCIR|nr:hypothetical protein [Mycolicibacterium iranicum]MBB2990269.1 hypothetical protein [Mycolicibacterium iranicum]